MPIPPYVAHLRTMVGRELLWMPGVTAVVLRQGPGGADEVLLVRRSDNGAWTPVTGIVDPGEEPHVTAVREVLKGANYTLACAEWVQPDWVQQGIVNMDAAQKAEQGGMNVVMDRCIMVEHRRHQGR